MSCKNINNEEVLKFILGDDGIVYGIGSTGENISVDKDCCESLGYIFDPNTVSCYWSTPCDDSNNIKILISPEGEDGVLYQIDENENCTLDIEFDYLLQFNCGEVLECQKGLIQSVDNKSEIEYKIDSNQSLINDYTNQLTTTQSNLNSLTTNTNNNIENNEQTIDSYNQSIVDINKQINDLGTKASYSKNTKTIDGYSKEISNLQTQIPVYEEAIIDLEKQNENLLILLDEQNAKQMSLVKSVSNEITLLLSENAKLSKQLAIVEEQLTNYSILNLFKDIVIKVSLEKFDSLDELENKDISYENSNRFIPVFEETIFEITDLITFFSGNNNTGIFFIDTNPNNCQALEEMLINEMGNDAVYLNDTSFNSNWVHIKIVITDEVILEAIKNKKLKLGVNISNNFCETSLLMDNIKFNKKCEVIEIKETVITENPSFNFNRVIDNKKSWVNYDIINHREFNLSERETAYDVNHHKLAINSKEVDINISSASAIESDVKDFILDNPTILGSISGIVTSNIFESDLTEEEFYNILYSEIIDVKSRQTISDYPLLKMLYENYLNSLDLINVKSSEFKYHDMFKFIDLIGNYWVDLVEQVIPSTTIWGSTYKYNNTIFDNNKFKYKKGTLFTCSAKKTVLPIIGEAPEVEVITEGDNPKSGPLVKYASGGITKCNNVYMIQINDGSEFIGSVTINGVKGVNFEGGDTIILNESEQSVLQKTT